MLRAALLQVLVKGFRHDNLLRQAAVVGEVDAQPNEQGLRNPGVQLPNLRSRIQGWPAALRFGVCHKSDEGYHGGYFARKAFPLDSSMLAR